MHRVLPGCTYGCIPKVQGALDVHTDDCHTSKSQEEGCDNIRAHMRCSTMVIRYSDADPSTFRKTWMSVSV